MFEKIKTTKSLSDKVLEILPELVDNTDMFSALAAMAEYVYLGYGSVEDISKEDLESCLEVITNECNFEDSLLDLAKADTKSVFKALNLEYVDGEEDSEDEDESDEEEECDCSACRSERRCNYDDDCTSDEDEDNYDEDYDDDDDYEEDDDDYEEDEDYCDEDYEEDDCEEDEEDLFAKNRQATFNTLLNNGIYSDYQG